MSLPLVSLNRLKLENHLSLLKTKSHDFNTVSEKSDDIS